MPDSLDDMGLVGPGAKKMGKKRRKGREESRDAVRKSGGERRRRGW